MDENLLKLKKNYYNEMNRNASIYGQEQLEENTFDEYRQLNQKMHEGTLEENEGQRLVELHSKLVEMFKNDEASADLLKEDFPDVVADVEKELHDLNTASEISGEEKRKNDFFGTKKRAAKRKIDTIKSNREKVDMARKDARKEEFLKTITDNPDIMKELGQNPSSQYELNLVEISKEFLDEAKKRGKTFPTSGPWRDMGRLMEKIYPDKNSELLKKNPEGQMLVDDEKMEKLFVAADDQYIIRQGIHQGGKPDEYAADNEQKATLERMQSRAEEMDAELEQFKKNIPELFVDHVKVVDAFNHYVEIRDLFKHLQVINDVVVQMVKLSPYYAMHILDASATSNEGMFAKRMEKTRISITAMASYVQKLGPYVEKVSKNPQSAEDFYVPEEITYKHMVEDKKNNESELSNKSRQLKGKILQKQAEKNQQAKATGSEQPQA